MLKKILVPIFACLICNISCKKIDNIDSKSISSEYSKKIPEIGLELTFSFQRNTPDDFRFKLSDNFSLEEKSSLFNTDQQVEYFILKCKKSDGTIYQVYGTVDAVNTATISFQKTIQ
jgi:hypothetical protein